MRNLLKMSVRSRAFGLILAGCVILFNCRAAERNETFDDMSFIEMINDVDLGLNSEFIQQFQNKEARKNLMAKFNGVEDCRLENFRNKEVLLITIPAKLLFAPNETLLNDKAGNYLAPFKRYLKEPDFYRVLLVMHTDNTGSEQYRDEITEERVESIFEWFEEQGCDTSYLFPYAMGDDMKLFENDSQKNREANRRLEIYLVPGRKMLEKAKKGRLEF